jgi:hypothetical protein
MKITAAWTAQALKNGFVAKLFVCRLTIQRDERKEPFDVWVWTGMRYSYEPLPVLN